MFLMSLIKILQRHRLFKAEQLHPDRLDNVDLRFSEEQVLNKDHFTTKYKAQSCSSSSVLDKWLKMSINKDKPTHSYLWCWEKPDMKLFQLRWWLCRCTHRCQNRMSLWRTARPCCLWSWHRICQSCWFHCCPCTRWWSTAGNRTPDFPSSLSYPQNPPWTQRASWWSLEGLYALSVGEKAKEIRPCCDRRKCFEF